MRDLRLIEVPTWTELKAIIDANPKFLYDHADSENINERIIIVRQSNDFSYYIRIHIDSADWTDYENNYSGSATRGQDSSINVNTRFSDSFNLDAFARLRVGMPQSLFDSKQIFNDQALFWDNVTVGNGSTTYRQSESSTRLECTTTSGDKAIRQTKEYFNYQAGKSLRLALTGVVGASKTGVRQRIGLFDNDNGIFLEQTETSIYLVKRTNTSGSVEETKISQANWNIDTMDGNGKSGITVDLSKAQILIFDIQWLGVGRVRIGFTIGGEIYYIHEFLHSNVVTKVYMRTPNLPVRYEIENTSTTASNTYMDCICAEVESEGGYNPKGVTRSISTGLTSQSVGSTYVPVLSIRLKSAYNRAQILPVNFKLYNASNTLVHCKLMHNGSLTGASWVSVGDNSLAEYDISSTAFSGGEFIDDMFVSSQGADRSQLASDVPESLLKLVSDYSGTSDILTIVAKSDGASSLVYGSIIFKEVY